MTGASLTASNDIMDMQIRATITRNSNGSVDLTPAVGEANAFHIERVTIHTAGTPSEKDFPVDSEATLTISSGVRSAELVSAPVVTSVSDAIIEPAPVTERRKK